MSLVYLWVRLSSGVMESSRWTAAIWCGLQPDRRRTGVSIKINARLWDLFAVTWKTLPGKTMWIQGTSSRLDRLPRLSTQNKRRNRYSLSRCTHRHTHTHVPSFSPHNHTGGCVRVHTASPTLSLQLSFFSAPSITHKHTKPDMDFDEKQTVWLSVRRQPAIILVGSVIFFWNVFLGVSLNRTRWMSHDSIYIWVRVNPHMSLVPSVLR